MEKEGGLEETLVQPRQWLLLLALLAGNVALALGPWFVRLADTGPVSAAFWRLFLALPFLALLARGTGQALTGIPRKTLFFVAIGAVSFGADLASWHIGVGLTRLGNATPEGSGCCSGALSARAGCRAGLRRWRLCSRWQGPRS